MTDIILSPSSTSTKIKTKESVNKIKYGSPKLQEVLRQRCRARMRERRDQLFNRNRFGLEITSNHVQSTLVEIIRQELGNLSTKELGKSDSELGMLIEMPMDPEEALAIENDIILEQEQWLIEQYELMLLEEAESAAKQLEEVVCPMCQKSALVEQSFCISCPNCNLQLTNCTDIKHLGCCLKKCINDHLANCTEVPDFIVLPENEQLHLHIMCNVCSTIELVV